MKYVNELIQELKNEQWEERLKEIYVDEQMIPYQKERYIDALHSYESTFSNEEVEIYSAPGRSEIGGNHTDHQHGEVLAASVNLDAIAVVSKHIEPKVQLFSKGYGMLEVDLHDLEAKKEEEGTSVGLIRGMAYGLKKNGHSIGGFKAYVTSDIVNGAGLSSSAAFEVLIGTILSGLYNNMSISPVEIAKMAQFAENVYMGKPSGLMDQMACSVGGLIHIDFKDITMPVVQKVNVDFSSFGYSLCITDTKGSHADLTPEYAAVPSEMKQIAHFFGKEFLREVNPVDFYQKIAELREKAGDRSVLRALHFFEENERVEGQVKALQEGNFPEFLDLIERSGQSSYQYLQNVYTNQDVNNQAVSIGLAISETILGDKGVCRVHGGGFAGTIQAFVANDFVENYRNTLDGVFGEGSCHVLKVRPWGGILVK